MRSVTVGTSTSAVFTASTSWAWVIGASSLFSRTLNNSIMRVSIVSGSFRVTMTSGFEDMESLPLSARLRARALFCRRLYDRPDGRCHTRNGADLSSNGPILAPKPRFALTRCGLLDYQAIQGLAKATEQGWANAPEGRDERRDTIGRGV